MSAATKEKGFDMKLVHYAITAILVFGGQFLPAMGPLTEQGTALIATFIGAIYGWTFIDMLWPSLIGLIGLSCAVGTMPVLGSSFGNPVVPMVLLIFAMISILSEYHVTEVISRNIINNRFAKGKPWVTVFFIFVGGFFCALINPFVAFILFTGILFNICTKTGIKPYSPFPATMLLGLALSIQIGKLVLPFLGTGVTLVAAYAAIQGAMPNFVLFMAFIIPMGLFVVVAYTLIMRFVLRVDVSPIKNLDESAFGEKQKLSKDQKKALAFMGLVVAVLLTPSILPATWSITIFLNKLTMFGQTGLVILLLMVAKREDGGKFFDFQKCAEKGISWDAIMMTAFIMAISTLMNADTTGIKPMLAMIIQPFQSFSPILFLVLIMVFVGFITNIANNMTLAIVFLPVILASAGSMGMEPLAVACILFLVAHLALMTPGASAFAGLAFAQTKWVKSTDMMKYGFIAVAILIPVFLAVAIPYSWLIF